MLNKIPHQVEKEVLKKGGETTITNVPFRCLFVFHGVADSFCEVADSFYDGFILYYYNIS